MVQTLPWALGTTGVLKVVKWKLHKQVNYWRVMKLRDGERPWLYSVSEMKHLFQKGISAEHAMVRTPKVFILKESQQEPSYKSVQKKLPVSNRGYGWKRKQRRVINSVSPLWERCDIFYISKQGWETIKLSWIFMLIFSSSETFCGDEGQCDGSLQAYWLENKWENKINELQLRVYFKKWQSGRMPPLLKSQSHRMG